MSNKLSIQDVQAREGVSRQTVHRWLSDGLPSTLETVKGVQQERRIDPEALENWLAAKRRQA